VTGTTRYQGAVIREHQILLLKQLDHRRQRSYWLLPGGRREAAESEQRCVQREVLEETGLHVAVHDLLLDEPGITGRSYQHRKTYRCQVLAGEAQPGYEPEAAWAREYTFTAVRWVDVRQPATWDQLIVADPITFPMLQRLQAALGYSVAAAPLTPR